ncbi:MAG: hypothetical protein HYY44_07320 [Deltaproteobacteria bacterium]|nr:hypothetical protein [Deltaproteobacteria bacterium]
MALVVDGLKPAGITVDSTGNSYVIGTKGLGADPLSPLTSLGYRVWIIKYDVCGNEVWSRTYLPNNGQGTAIAIGPSGFIYVAAQAYSLGLAGRDIYIGKLNSATGDVVWWRVFDGPGTVPAGGDLDVDFDRPDDLTVDSHGNIFVTGVITSEIITDSGGFYTGKKDLWVGKFRENTSGTADLLAETTYNGPADGSDEGKALLLDSTESSLYVTGYSKASSAPWNHLFLQKYSAADLSPLWASPVEGSVTGGEQGVVGESVKFNEGLLYVGGIAGAADLTGWRPESDGFIGFFDSSTGIEKFAPLYLNGAANQRDGVMDILVDSPVLYLTGARTDAPQTDAVYSGDMWTARINLETRAAEWSDTITAGSRGRADLGSRLARDSAGSLYVVGELEVEAPVTSPPCIHSYCFHQYVIHKYCAAEAGP